MEREHGNKEFPIWLLGDSEPQKWKKVLEFPLDERHPIRHNIWTSVIDPIQDILFRQLKVRINTSEIYIRNAITNPKNKPKQTDKTWVNQHIKEAINIFSNEIQNFQPIIIFCFGSFAYEFCCRSYEAPLSLTTCRIQRLLLYPKLVTKENFSLSGYSFFIAKSSM